MPRKPTHKVSFYGVRCYNDDHTGDLWGCNWFWDLLITPAVAWHWTLQFLIPGYGEEGFPLKVLETYEN